MIAPNLGHIYRTLQISCSSPDSMGHPRGSKNQILHFFKETSQFCMDMYYVRGVPVISFWKMYTFYIFFSLLYTSGVTVTRGI